MFLPTLDPNLTSVFRFEPSLARYDNIHHGNVNFLKFCVNVFLVRNCLRRAPFLTEFELILINSY